MSKNNSTSWLTSNNDSDVCVKSPQERMIMVDGIRAHYFESGSSKQSHLLFIHGLGSSAERWLDIPLALSSYFHTIAIDLPGSGMSDRPQPAENMKYTIQDFTSFIVEFMREIGIDTGNASLVGHSLGGYIAANVAVQNKELVDQLVLIDTSGMLDGPTPLLKQYLQAALNPNRKAVREVFEQLVANPIRIPDILVDAFIYRIGLQGSKEAFVAAFNDSVGTQIGKEMLQQIRNRTLLIWGTQDRLIPLEPYCKIFQQAISGSRQVVIEDAGHAPFAEKPAVVCEVLRQFLNPK